MERLKRREILYTSVIIVFTLILLKDYHQADSSVPGRITKPLYLITNTASELGK
jgi:hypothetical protein